MPFALPAFLPQVPLDGDFSALHEHTRAFLRTSPEPGNVYKVGVVIPLARLVVLAPFVDCHAERDNCHARLCALNLRVACEVAADDGFVDAHMLVPACLCPFALILFAQEVEPSVVNPYGFDGVVVLNFAVVKLVHRLVHVRFAFYDH